ncbi:MAG: DNA recombination protein RmuC [Phycisphaerales bacterium]
MEIAIIVLSVASVFLAGALAWALLGRAQFAKETGEARGNVESLERELAYSRDRLVQDEGVIEELRLKLQQAQNDLARADERREATARELAERGTLEKRFSDAFKALSAEALKSSRDEFIQQAKPVFEAAKKEHSELVKPIGETLAATREKLEQIEKARTESFAKLMTNVESMTGANNALRDETARLTRALSKPEIRGQYGEIQLKRVAELAGMTSYCDFVEQASQRDAKGNLLRPDMVVKLPNERVIAIDAKTNTLAYIEAVNEPDEKKRDGHLDRFAKHVSEQAKKLADKSYWAAWQGSAEFVVMFVPGDHFIDAALQRKPELLEEAAQRGVILASPSTLIGLLRAVAVGWHEHKLAQETRELIRLGVELHERAGAAFEHADKLGDSIRQSVERYNKLVGSIDSRLTPTLKKFEDAGAKSGKPLAELKPVDGSTRMLQAAGASPTNASNGTNGVSVVTNGSGAAPSGKKA